MVSAQIKAEISVRAKQLGAVDWIKKSAIGNDLIPAVRRYMLK
jgi:FixJ family two-component response regulator